MRDLHLHLLHLQQPGRPSGTQSRSDVKAEATTRIWEEPAVDSGEEEVVCEDRLQV